MNETATPSTVLRRDLTRILMRVQNAGDHVPITHYDRPAAVLVPAEWYERATTALAPLNSAE